MNLYISEHGAKALDGIPLHIRLLLDQLEDISYGNDSYPRFLLSGSPDDGCISCFAGSPALAESESDIDLVLGYVFIVFDETSDLYLTGQRALDYVAAVVGGIA